MDHDPGVSTKDATFEQFVEVLLRIALMQKEFVICHGGYDVCPGELTSELCQCEPEATKHDFEAFDDAGEELFMVIHALRLKQAHKRTVVKMQSLRSLQLSVIFSFTFDHRSKQATAPAAKFEVPEIDTNPFKMASVGNLQLLQTLVEPPANPEGKPAAPPLNVNAKDPYGYTPLIWAARNGHVEVMDYLVANGGDLEVTSFGGMRAIHHAVNQSRLIELGANVEVQDDAGNTPLHFTASRGILNPITLLLSAGAKVNAANKQEATPLVKAVNASHATTVEKLIDNEANVNHANSEGNSALHLVARGGFVSIVRMLLESRATTATRNKQGKTAKELASSSDIAKLIE